MMNSSAGLLLLRVGLGAVFIVFGIGKFQHDYWARSIETMEFFQRLPFTPAAWAIYIGAMEAVTGVGLVLGLGTRIFASLAAAQLLGILILLNFQEIRDIGLLGAALYLALSPYVPYGIDGARMRIKRQERKKG